MNASEMPSEIAEEALLAAVLSEPSAFADVRDTIDADAFRILDHRTIYEAMLAVTERGATPDLTNVNDALTARGHEDTTVTLFRIATSAFTPFLVMDYAQRVAHYARRHKVSALLSETFTTFHREVDADPVETVYALLSQVADLGSVDGDPVLYGDVIEQLQERLTDQLAGTWEDVAMPTGLHSVDHRLTGGLRPGELIIVAGRPGSGKALSLDTPIPTPDGWTTMGDIKAGDVVFDERGMRCRVTYATPVQMNRTCYKVVFSDGSEIVADADHRWLTSTRKDRKSEIQARRYDRLGRNPDSPYSVDQSHKRTFPSVVTTQEILDTLHVGSDRRKNHAVKVAGALKTTTIRLPIKPYTLGAWLGDGTSDGGSITKPDPEMWERIEDDGYKVGPDISGKGDRCTTRTVYGIRGELRNLDLLGNKHIPGIYLRACEHDRWELLSGLVDTDGSVSPSGSVEFGSMSKVLADGVYELVCSLGMQARKSVKVAKVNGKVCGNYHRVTFRPTRQVFYIPRKADRVGIGNGRASNDLRYIVDVIPVESVPVRCITVDSPSHLYLAGESMIPTHNTALGMQIVQNIARSKAPALVFSAEMNTLSLMERALSEVSGVPAERVRSKRMDQSDYDRLMRATEIMGRMPVAIDDTSAIKTTQMLARAQRFKRRHGLSLLMFDYMELAGDDMNESEQMRITRISHALKGIAKTLEIPVVALSQLSRKVEERTPPIPRMSDLRMSGAIEADADKILFIYRHDYYAEQGVVDFEQEKQGTADIIIGKQRNGMTGNITVRFDAETMRFMDLDEDPSAKYDMRVGVA